MKLYLDNNIFAYFENSSLTISDLENIIGNRIDKIYYSDAHIQEVLEMGGQSENEKKERIKQRLLTIGMFTQNHYMRENKDNEILEDVENPFEVIETITEVPFAQSAMKSFMNLITEEKKIEIRKTLGIDPEKINNYSPKEVVQQLSNKLSSLGPELTFLEMIESSISHHPDAKTFGRSNRIAAIFEALDMLGYWKDKPTDKSDYARFWDSSHCSYASHCDYFVSNDKRTVNKSKVIYEIYGIETKIIMPFNKNNG